MPLHIDASDIAIRLALAFLAGLLFGFDRGEHGKPAGLRTTLLVCLTAAIAMILANVMLDTDGKSSSSFAVLDLMRLPLGILTGIGFIGAGTILKKGDLVVGVTTAATVWYVTMIGLTLGAGQLGLGIAGTVVGMMVLWVMRWVENHMQQERRGSLTVIFQASVQEGAEEPALRKLILRAGCSVGACSMTYGEDGRPQILRYEVRWHAQRRDSRPPEFLKKLVETPGLKTIRWNG